MFKKGVAVTVIFIISLFIQLVSQIVVTRLVGATLSLDIFLAAVALPTIIVTVIYGTLNDAFLPLLGERRVKSEATTDAYFFTHLFTLAVISLLVTVIMNFFSLPISRALYAGRGEEFIQAVATQMNFMLYSAPFAVIATMLGSYFYSRKQFLRFPIAQLFGSVFNLLLIVLLFKSMGTWSLVFAFVINIALQILFVIPKASYSINFSYLKLGSILLAWTPLIIGSFAIRTDTLLIRSFASHLPEGSLVYLNLIAKIFALGTSVMTIGIQVILLPHLVEYFSQKKYDQAIKDINKTKVVSIIVSVCVTLLIALIAPVVIKLLFVGNKFTMQDADNTISLIPFFILPAIGWGLTVIFYQPLLALKKQMQLGILSVVSMILGWSIGWGVLSLFGALAGIVAGLTVLLFSSIIGSEVLWQMYRRSLVTKSP